MAARPQEATPEEAPEEAASVTDSNGCYIHLFDGGNFDEDDDHFKLTEPGSYANLDNLPGASKNWTDEADSVKVGGNATVIIYSERDFGGTAMTLEAGSEHPDLDSEPYSLEMTCD